MAEAIKENESIKGGIYTARRDFFTLAGWWAFFVTMLVYAWETLGPKGFFFPKVLFEPSKVFPVGFPTDFVEGTVTTIKARTELVIT